jgi:hypothetical protein
MEEFIRYTLHQEYYGDVVNVSVEPNYHPKTILTTVRSVYTLHSTPFSVLLQPGQSLSRSLEQ